MDDNFAGSNICILNPKNCGAGLSVSLFYKLEFAVDPNDLETNFTKAGNQCYLLSWSVSQEDKKSSSSYGI